MRWDKMVKPRKKTTKSDLWMSWGEGCLFFKRSECFTANYRRSIQYIQYICPQWLWFKMTPGRRLYPQLNHQHAAIVLFFRKLGAGWCSSVTFNIHLWFKASPILIVQSAPVNLHLVFPFASLNHWYIVLTLSNHQLWFVFITILIVCGHISLQHEFLPVKTTYFWC